MKSLFYFFLSCTTSNTHICFSQSYCNCTSTCHCDNHYHPSLRLHGLRRAFHLRSPNALVYYLLLALQLQQETPHRSKERHEHGHTLLVISVSGVLAARDTLGEKCGGVEQTTQSQAGRQRPEGSSRSEWRRQTGRAGSQQRDEVLEDPERLQESGEHTNDRDVASSSTDLFTQKVRVPGPRPESTSYEATFGILRRPMKSCARPRILVMHTTRMLVVLE
jgi:hypothetical protein